MTTLTTSNPAVVTTARPTSRRIGWAHVGTAAGVLALFTFVGASSGVMVDTEAYADNALVLDALADKEVWVWLLQTCSFLLAVTVAGFGVGLRRHLAGQEPAGSLVPDLAGAGLLLVSVMCLVGGGINTEMFHALRNAGEVDPDTIGAHLALVNTMGWVWAGGALTTGAVAVAGLRRGSVSRGLGRFAAVMTGLIVLTQVLPFQYMAVLPVTLFLLVTGVAMARSQG